MTYHPTSLHCAGRVLRSSLALMVVACASDQPTNSFRPGVTGSNSAGSGTATCVVGGRVLSGADCGPGQTATGTGATSGGTPGVYLKRRGTELTYDGKPYRSVGVNAFGMAGCETGRAYSDAQMDGFFASLRPYALTRAWAFQAQGITGVERMVRSAEAHGQLLILSLADGRGFCDESDGRVGGEGSGKQPEWYTDGYKTRYLPWLAMVVTRFKDSPAIGFWELINEPGGNGTTDQTIRAFLDDAAARIKAIDGNHLVLSGSQAEYVRGTTDYAYVHGGPDIDAASLHEYDYDSGGHAIVSPHLRPTLSAMKSIDKPLLITEVGIYAGTDQDCTSLETRRDVFKQKFDAYYAQVGLAAVLVWSWVPNPHSGCPYEASKGDPLMSLLASYP